MRLALRDAAQMRADADQHEPVLLALLGAVGVGRRASSRAARRCGRWSSDRSASLTSAAFLISSLRAVADEHRLAAPHHGDGLAFLDRVQVDLDRGERLSGGVRVHLMDERPQDRSATNGREHVAGNNQEVPASRLFGVRCHVYLQKIERTDQP